MKKELEGKYAVVTATSTFKMRYVVPTESLQELNTDFDLDENAACTWAEECVMMEQVKDFSQSHLGETVIDVDIVDEDHILELFDKDNDYLSEWTTEKKIDYIRNWEDNYTKKQKEV